MTENVRRQFFVGDVHGCADELRSLIDKIRFDPDDGKSEIIFVGDLIGKGPKSKECLEFVREYKQSVKCILGNHDLYVLYCARTLPTQKPLVEKYAPKHILDLMDNWRGPNQKHKRLSEIHLEDAESLDELDIRYICENMPLYRTFNHDRVFTIHAGLAIPTDDTQGNNITNLLDKQDPKCLLLCRDMFFEEKPTDEGLMRWSQNIGDVMEGSRQWAELWKGPSHCFYGHDARRNLTINDYATGLDTAAVYGRFLTAALVYVDNESGKVVESIQSVRKLLEKDGLLEHMDRVITPQSGVTHTLFSVRSHAVYSKPGKGVLRHGAPKVLNVPRNFWIYSAVAAVALGVTAYFVRREIKKRHSLSLNKYV